MQIAPSDFLRLAENAGTIACWDVEATGLRGDYDSILVVSVKPYGQKPVTFQVTQPGNDQRVVREARDYLNTFDCWVTYYGKGFDLKLINTRLLKWNLAPVDKIHHIDMYYQGKSHLLTARRSQGHLLNWLETPEEKMSVSADMWVQVVNPKTKDKAMKIMVDRCESDCAGLEALYDRLKHIIGDIKR